jgi:hypothetical protein
LGIFFEHDILKIEVIVIIYEDMDCPESSSATYDLKQAALDGYGIDVILAIQEFLESSEAQIKREAQGMGLSTEDVQSMHSERSKRHEVARDHILQSIKEKAVTLPYAHRNWLCGYLKSNYAPIFPNLSIEDNSLLDSWQKKIDGIVSVCLNLPATLPFKLLVDILGSILWLEEVASRQRPLLPKKI